MKTHVHTLAAKLLSVILLVGLTACEHNGESEPPALVHRTILVYMVANNDLGSYGYDDADLNEMLHAAQTGGLNGGRLIVYHAPYHKAPALKEITTEGIVELKCYDNDILSVSASRMKQVIADTKSIAQADDYGIILWSHASGWLQNGIDETQTVPFITPRSEASPHAYGSENNKYMNITTLAKVLEGEDFEFVYCDCCYMANIEVAYELRNATQYIVGSATELPADGMRYDLNIPVLMQNGTPDLVQTARNTYMHYSNQPLSINQTCTMSVIYTAALDELAATTRDIYASGASFSPEYKPQPFELGSECRYFDFETYVKAFDTDSELQNKWSDAMDKAVLYKVNTPMIWGRLELRNHCGLSTYPLSAPAQATDYGYSELQWFQDVASNLKHR